MDDWSLLQQYVRDGLRTALDELIRRHMGMVYSTARRQVGDPHLAEDVTQAVFMILMRRASGISSKVVLPGWLHNVTRHAAANALRARRRRRHHEHHAIPMGANPGPRPEDTWGRIGPVLDDAIGALPRSDRDAVVMKYLEGKTYHEVAASQNISENTARQRLFRALGRLRAHLRQRGCALSDDALGSALVFASVHEVPGQLIDIIGVWPSDGANAIAHLSLRTMFMVKLKFIAAAAAGLIVILGVGGLMIYHAVAGTEPVAPPAASAVSAAAPPATQPGYGSMDTPKGTLFYCYRAIVAGDEEAVLSCFDRLTPQETLILRRSTQVMAAACDFRSALEARFGKAITVRLMQVTGLDGEVNEDNLNQGQVTPQGDIDFSRLGPQFVQKVHMIQVGNVWKFSDPALLERVNVSSQVLVKAVPAIRRLSALLKGGSFRTIQDMRLQMQPMMQEINQSMESSQARRSGPRQ